MKNLDLTVQVRSGGFAGAPADPTDIIKRLDAVLSRLPVTRVIMGWSTDPEVYERAAHYLFENGVELYLWLPVFSELGLVHHCRFVIGPSGQPPASYQLDETENFEFYCPNSPENIQACLDVFDQHFAALGFAGVFLDKIRYPSFVNGKDGGLSCFCPRCLTTYEQAGIDVDALMGRIGQLANANTPFGVTAYQDGHYQFADDIWRQFFELRANAVSASLHEICDHLRLQGYQIGLDVFAPFMSEFVGQDIAELSHLADFIKPMMYATTFAPAGLPFEMAAMLRETGMSQKAGQYYALLGLDDSKRPFDIDFCARQIAELSEACVCPVHPGIEINQVPRVADTNPDYIKRCLDAYKDVDGVVLSWNLMDMPTEHLQAVANWLN